MNACPVCGLELEEGPYCGEIDESSEWCENGHYRHETLTGWRTYIIGGKEITYHSRDGFQRAEIDRLIAAARTRWQRFHWARKVFWRTMHHIDNFLHRILHPFRGDGPLERFEFAFCQWSECNYFQRVPEDWQQKKPDPQLADEAFI